MFSSFCTMVTKYDNKRSFKGKWNIMCSVRQVPESPAAQLLEASDDENRCFLPLWNRKLVLQSEFYNVLTALNPSLLEMPAPMAQGITGSVRSHSALFCFANFQRLSIWSVKVYILLQHAFSCPHPFKKAILFTAASNSR